MSEVTIGELSRRLDALKSDMTESIRKTERDCESRASGHVPTTVFQMSTDRVNEKISGLGTEISNARTITSEKVGELRADMIERITDLEKQFIELKGSLEEDKKEKSRLRWATIGGIVFPTIVGLIILAANVLVGGGTP